FRFGKERLRHSEAAPVVIRVEKPGGDVSLGERGDLHAHRVESVDAAQLDLVPVGVGLVGLLRVAGDDVGQTADAEDLRRPHVLEQIAHEQVGRGLDVGRGNVGHLRGLVDELPRIGFDGEADDVELGVVLGARLARGFVDEPLAHGAVLRPEDDRDRFGAAIRPDHRLGGDGQRARRRANVLEGDGAVALEADVGTPPQHLEHALDVGAEFVRRAAGVVDAVAVDVDGRGDGRLEAERAGDADDGLVDLGPVDENLFGGRLVVGDGFEGDVRNDAADLFAFAVLLSFIYESPGRAAS